TEQLRWRLAVSKDPRRYPGLRLPTDRQTDGRAETGRNDCPVWCREKRNSAGANRRTPARRTPDGIDNPVAVRTQRLPIANNRRKGQICISWQDIFSIKVVNLDEFDRQYPIRPQINCRVLRVLVVL